MKEHKYLKEEFHRNEWQPLMIVNREGEKVQDYARITEEEAERMNLYKNDYKVRYVLEAKKPKKAKKEVETNSKLDEIRAEYESVVGKKAFHGWDEEKLLEKIEEAKN